MPGTNWIRGAILAAAAVAAAIVWLEHGGIDMRLIRALVSASSVVIFALVVYDSWAWRQPGLRRLTKRPVLHGTWKVELATSFESRAHETIEAYLVARQSYSRIQVGMLFDRSRSRSISGDILFEAGECHLYYLFRTEAGALHRKGNPPARGGAALTIGRKPGVHLEGDYWTERNTHGSLRSLGHSGKCFDTFAGAQTGDYK